MTERAGTRDEYDEFVFLPVWTEYFTPFYQIKDSLFLLVLFFPFLFLLSFLSLSLSHWKLDPFLR
jgi:hypothetical protein